MVPLGGSPLYLSWGRQPLEFHTDYPFARVIVPPRSERLRAMVVGHPRVFSAHHAFPTPDRDAKWTAAAQAWPTDRKPLAPA